MIDTLFRKTTIISIGFCSIAIVLIMLFSMTKTIEISGLSQDEVTAEATRNLRGNGGKVSEGGSQNSTNYDGVNAVGGDLTDQTDSNYNELAFSGENEDSEYLCIPIPEKIGVENITVENHYMDSILYVIIDGVNDEFYENTALSGNRKNISKAYLEDSKNEVRLHFDLDGLYEFKTVLENNSLYISFYQPRELYDKIVVIDPACGGKDEGDSLGDLLEKDINLQVAKALKTKLDASSVKAYYTRMDDVNPSWEDRIEIANLSKADAYVRIETDFREDASVYGVTAVYNDDYFIPGFGNVELSDLIEREVVTSIKGRALGLEKTRDEDITLKYSKVPSTTVKIGCLSNTQEAVLLGREDYIDRIAEGIYAGIMKMYETN